MRKTIGRAVLITGALLVPLCALADDQHQTTDLLPFTWRRSLPLDARDSAIAAIGGTEARSLVGLGGKLYAGIGYWSDSQEADSRLPGGQVLVLDSPDSSWRVDLNLDERVAAGPDRGKRRYFAVSMLYGATISTDGQGQPLSPPAKLLLAGAWDREGKLEVFSKSVDSDKWGKSELSSAEQSRHAEIRSFAVYKDKVTGVDHVFAGARINHVAKQTQICSGIFNRAKGQIVWNEQSEAWADNTPDLTMTTRGSGRITGFAECNGKLYASVFNMIFERHDGNEPVWKMVYRYQPVTPLMGASSGFRGLTSIDDPASGHQSLIVSLEHRPCVIVKIDPANFRGTVEINASKFLQEQWQTKVGYMIAGYNDMLKYHDPVSQQKLTLIGFEAAAPQMADAFDVFNRQANFLVRSASSQYRVQQIFDKSLGYDPPLVSVRTIVNSPFGQDPPGTVYAGGFDANSIRVHNTAWIYRGVRLNAKGDGAR